MGCLFYCTLSACLFQENERGKVKFYGNELEIFCEFNTNAPLKRKIFLDIIIKTISVFHDEKSGSKKTAGKPCFSEFPHPGIPQSKFTGSVNTFLYAC